MIGALVNNKVIRLLRWLNYLRVYKFRRDTWYFIFNYGIGDTYLACAFLPYLLERGDKVTVFITKSSHEFIPKLFSPAIDVIFGQPLELALIEEFGQYGKGHPIILHPMHVVNRILLNIIGYKRFNLTDLYKVMLGLDLRLPPVQPQFATEPAVEAEVTALFEQYKLPLGKTVLVCPKAVTIKEVADDFWKGLADKLAEQGLKPIFMNSTAGLPDYPTVEFSLRAARAFCDRAGQIISLRSGFCDLIATTTARMAILYPSIKWFEDPLLTSTGLAIMGIRDEHHLLEITHNFETDSTLVYQAIIQFFHE